MVIKDCKGESNKNVVPIKKRRSPVLVSLTLIKTLSSCGFILFFSGTTSKIHFS